MHGVSHYVGPFSGPRHFLPSLKQTGNRKHVTKCWYLQEEVEQGMWM